MAWTSYDDQLAQQAIALMTEPDWQKDTTITGMLNSINATLKTDGATLGQSQDTKMATLLQQFNDAYTAGNTANTSRYNQILSGYGTLNSNAATAQNGVTSNYGSLINQNTTNNNNVLSGYQDQITNLTGQLNTLGGQARQDVTNTFNQQRAASDQQLTSRGLGNTSVRSAAMQGLDSAQATSMNQLNQQLIQQNLGYQTQWGNDKLNAMQANNQNSTALGLQNLGFQERSIGQNAQLGKAPLDVMENRTDVTPSLGDIANLTMQLGRGSAQTTSIPQLQALMSIGSSPYASAMGTSSTPGMFG